MDVEVKNVSLFLHFVHPLLEEASETVAFPAGFLWSNLGPTERNICTYPTLSAM